MDILIIVTTVILIITVIILALYNKFLHNRVKYLENIIIKMVEDLNENN